MGGGLWERVAASGGPAVVRTAGVPAAEVVGRLERGETPARLARELGLEPLDLVAAIAHDALGSGDQDEGPALVQGPPRRPGLATSLAEASWAEVFPAPGRPARLALAAGLLQVHDFWDASHRAAQEADDLGERSVSAYWHGIAHRREPDPGNAAYWFRRVGRHPAFTPLAAAAGRALGSDPLAARLLPRGAWDPLAFVDLCASADPGRASLLRRLQRLEMIALLGASVPGA